MHKIDDSAPHYPTNSLIDMARIPEEALPRFLAELPAILAELRPVAAMLDALPEDVRAELAGMVTTNPVWVDDDKGLVQFKVTAEGEATEMVFDHTRPLKPAA